MFPFPITAPCLPLGIVETVYIEPEAILIQYKLAVFLPGTAANKMLTVQLSNIV
jgi:hypothetical protein